MADEEASIDQMSSLIETDMALSAAIVRTVNSALFGLLKRVESVHDGIRYLGMAQVAGMTYEIGLRGAFPPSPLLQDIWDRAGVRGLAMGRIARQLDMDPWHAHTLGLFAESGRAVLIAHDKQQYSKLCICWQARNCCLCFLIHSATKVYLSATKINSSFQQSLDSITLNSTKLEVKSSRYQHFEL